MKLKIKDYQAFLLAIALLTSSSIASGKTPQSSNSNRELQKAYYQLIKKPISLKKKRNHKKVSATRHTNTNHRNRAVQAAKQQLRKKYRWGGKSPHTGFDCSGLMQYAYQKANIQLPRTTTEQYKKTQRIQLTNLRVGDLIFFKTRRTRQRVNHVGIYMGGGNFIHAPRRGRPVSVSKLNKYWRKKVVGAGRV
ncbi:MAG: C40 family peptidase [Cocleimonas sp.]